MEAVDFDTKVDQMIIADGLRARFTLGGRRNIYLIDSPWTMQDDPWFLFWNDGSGPKGVYLLGSPVEGEKYAMFNVYDEFDERHVQYVFLKDKYISSEDAE